MSPEFLKVCMLWSGAPLLFFFDRVSNVSEMDINDHCCYGACIGKDRDSVIEGSMMTELPILHKERDTVSGGTAIATLLQSDLLEDGLGLCHARRDV